MGQGDQPSINIGLVGHVDHGKTTLTKALTGEWTDRHSEELKRGISIKLGYANAIFYKCDACPEPECYTVDKKCSHCGGKAEFLRSVSFVDAPGHETLMATMLSGASLMDGALLLIAANEKCPQPQTKEHLMALTITDVKNVLIVQNKIDIVSNEAVKENHEQIVEFIKESPIEDAPIIPISAHHDVNLDVLIQAIIDRIPLPDRDPDGTTRMFVARSFDVNPPGTLAKDLKGGVIGGSLMTGTFKEGDEIEMYPGLSAAGGGDPKQPISSVITTLHSGGKKLKMVGPGGLIAIGTNLDPVLTKSDSLTGKVAGKPGTLPPVWESFTLEVNLLDHVVGSSLSIKVDPVRTGEPLMLNVGTATTVGMVKSARSDNADVNLKIPLCAEEGQRVAISRRLQSKWRLIGFGTIA